MSARAARALDEFLFPTAACIACGRASLNLLCPPCEAARPKEAPACPRCADRMKGELCLTCSSNPMPVEETIALGRHDGSWAVAVRRFKYEAPWLAPLFVSLLLEKLAGKGPFHLVEGVPMYPTKRAERGWNPPVLLARELERRTTIPFRGRLLRTRETASQVGMGRSDRLANLEGAFVCAHGPELPGSHALLLDDVMTTGTTIRGCAEALLARGVAKVTVAVVARDWVGP
ncbi:ComF family protein [bacterium]|nr:ComF family protein [bacterium]